MLTDLLALSGTLRALSAEEEVRAAVLARVRRIPGVAWASLRSGRDAGMPATAGLPHLDIALDPSNRPHDFLRIDIADEAEFAPFRDVLKHVGALLAERLDILASRAERERVQERAQALESIIDGSRIGTWVWNVQTGETRFNERWAEMLGYRLEDLEPLSIKTWEGLSHPDDLKRADAALQEHFAGRRTHYESEVRLRHRSGHWIWVLDRGQLFSRTADGRPQWMAGSHTDITLRKQAELERQAAQAEAERLLAESATARRALLSILEDHQRTAHALEHSESGLREAQRLAGIGSWQLDLVTDHLEWSDEVFRIFELARADFDGNPETFNALIHPDDRELVERAYRQAVESHQEYEIVHRLQLANGQIKYVHERGHTEYDARGRALRTHGTVQDVTERKRHQAYMELQARRAAALLDLPRVAESESEAALFEHALEHAEDLTGSQIGFFHFIAADQTTVEMTAWSKRTRTLHCTAPHEGHHALDKAGIWADALRQRRAQVVNDWGRKRKKRPLPEGHAELHRLINAPVVDDARVVALIGVGNKATPYDDSDVETVQLLAAETWRLLQRRRAARALEASEARYRHLVDRMSDGVVVYLPSGEAGQAGYAEDFVVREFNAAAERITGARREDVIARRVTEAFPAVAQLGLLDVMREVALDGRSRDLPEEVYDDGLRRMWVENFVFRLPTGEVVAVFSDITERKQAEERRRLADRVFHDTVEGVMITDRAANLVSVNPAFTRITGYEADEVIGHNPRMLASGRQDPGFYVEMWRELEAQGHWRGELWNRRKNGEVYPEWITISRVTDDSGVTSHYVGVFSDITSLKAAEARVQFLAQHDPLTELPNRNLFLDRLNHAIKRARREHQPLHVMFIDLDRFKNVNDSLGHPVGDELLITVSRRMQGVLRASDTLARVGGDEFLVLLEDDDGPNQVSVVARKLLDVMLEPMEIAGHSISVSASVGISTFPSDGDNADLLMRHADRAMYEAKRMGRNTFRLFTPELDAGATELLVLENDLRAAIGRNQLLLHYQPLIDMRDNSLAGAEALLRWKHPHLGYVSPQEFIPLAEDIGIIHELGAWVLHEACRQVRAWDAQGLHLSSIAVNLSTRQVNRSDLVRWIRSELTHAGLVPERLELEVTESQLMRDPETSRKTLVALQNMGVRVAIDDFGTGYSSLAYLKMLPLDHLKIDRSFVRDIAANGDAEAIVRATIALAGSLRLGTIAEGVETRAQADFLRANGVIFAQGYLFGIPVPAETFLKHYGPTPETASNMPPH